MKKPSFRKIGWIKKGDSLALVKTFKPSWPFRTVPWTWFCFQKDNAPVSQLDSGLRIRDRKKRRKRSPYLGGISTKCPTPPLMTCQLTALSSEYPPRTLDQSNWTNWDPDIDNGAPDQYTWTLDGNSTTLWWPIWILDQMTTVWTWTRSSTSTRSRGGF